MRPKEIQEKLGTDADRIKLFKREDIFFPENPPSGNRSTNYTETGCENLRLLVVLTKSGLTCSDIRKLQDGEWTLEEAIVSRKQSIDAEIARKRNSLSLLSELLDDKAEFETFETDRYWNVITKKEAAGEKFIDIEDMYVYRPVSFIRNIQCPHCGEEHEVVGAKAKHAIEQARIQVAVAIGSKPNEITFTSGGSEANNWVLRSIAEIYYGESIHIITSSIEHHSILNACHSFERNGIDVTYLPVDSKGRVSIDDVKVAIKPNTKLVSIMLANNEIGTIQPIAEIGRFLKKQNILFHTDAVQAVGHIPVDVNNLNVDFLSASAHKFNGSKGIGILYKRLGTKLAPLIFGGEQEQGLRAGTENVAGIVAAGYAIEESVAIMGETTKQLKVMIDNTLKYIKFKIPTVYINGSFENRLPGTVNLGFDGVSGESLMHLLDLKGICVSTSSACTSGKNKPSHVLIALGLTEQQAKSAIRISYGRYNTSDDINTISSSIFDAYAKIIASR